MKCTQQSHIQFEALARQPTFQHALPQPRCKMYPTGILRTSWNIPAQIQGPWLPPGSTEFMPGIRSPSLVGRHPALPTLPCPPAWQSPSIQGSSPAAAQGLQDCGRRDQGHAQLFPQVLLLLPPPFLPLLCINPYLNPAPKFEICSVAINKVTWTYTVIQKACTS